MKFSNDFKSSFNRSKSLKRSKRFKKSALRKKSQWKNVLAQTMRDFPTFSEALVTEPMKHMGFLSQVVLFGYIADFAHTYKRIIVEIDGSVHDDQIEYDHRRDEVFRSHGWKVLRFKNSQVTRHPMDVYDSIKKELVA